LKLNFKFLKAFGVNPKSLFDSKDTYLKKKINTNNKSDQS
jgi:hypothetical protein